LEDLFVPGWMPNYQDNVIQSTNVLVLFSFTSWYS
jgi:hypothetical protein